MNNQIFITLDNGVQIYGLEKNVVEVKHKITKTKSRINLCQLKKKSFFIGSYFLWSKYKICPPVNEYKLEPHTLDAWVFGFWLGSRLKFHIHELDKIVIADPAFYSTLNFYFRKQGLYLHKEYSEDNKIYTIRSIISNYSFKNFLKNYEISSSDIHIPKLYLFSHSKVRKKLVRGLMNGSGYRNNDIFFNHIPKEIRKDLYTLYSELGYGVYENNSGKLFLKQKQTFYNIKNII